MTSLASFAAIAACADSGSRDGGQQPDATVEGAPNTSPVVTTSSPASALIMPAFTGESYTVLGDSGRLEGFGDRKLRVRWIANATAAPLMVFWQSPAAGTVVTDALEIWVSTGGPIIEYGGLPSADRGVAERLGISADEPIQVFSTSVGNAYKVDDFLFAESCRAVDEAYRKSIDPSYSDVCVSVEGRMLGR